MRIIKCPNCHAELPADFIAPGTRVECALCDAKFVVPEEEKNKTEKNKIEEKPLLLTAKPVVEQSSQSTAEPRPGESNDNFVFSFGAVVKFIYHIFALLVGIIGIIALLVLLSQDRHYQAGVVFVALIIFAWLWLSGYFALCWLLGIYQNVLDIKKSLGEKRENG